MLKKIKTNISNCKEGYEPLVIDNQQITDDTDGTITITTDECHNLMSNDEVLLRRIDGRRIEFSQRAKVNEINDDKEFTISSLGLYPISPSSYELVDRHLLPTEDMNEATYLRLTFTEENKHIFCINRDEVEAKGIKGYYFWNSGTSEYEYTGNSRLCEGDYVLYDGAFLRQIANGEEKERTIKSVSLTNNVNENILKNCVVPVNTNGYDNRYELLIPKVNNNWFFGNLETNTRTLSLYADDTRFWSNRDHPFREGRVFRHGTTINKITGDLELDFGVGSDFAIDLYQRENFLNYAEEVAGRSVNSIINYERYPYSPMYYKGKASYDTSKGEIIDNYFFKNAPDLSLKSVKKINFKLNFRVKDYTSDDDGYTRDYGSWNTDNYGYWNNYTIKKDGKQLEAVYPVNSTDKNSSRLHADLLGHLGFTDEDIFYQSDALKKSFLRLSFYDTPNRETQKLLFYSTVYFDTNELYKKYCNILAYYTGKETKKSKQYVYDANDVLVTSGYVLDATLSCTDKFNEDSSADGFYLHLFEKMVSGYSASMIYMKAEFNNAKYGKTVPLTMPSWANSNGPIPPVGNNAKSFPMDYFYTYSGETEDDTIKTQTVNMGKLLNDMYIKVMIKFDRWTNRFVWFIPRNNNGENKQEFTFELFEPRVTGYDAYSEQSIDTGYGTEYDIPKWIDLENGAYFNNGVYHDEDGNTEANSSYITDCVLYTTATTLSNDSLLVGTKLFNHHSRRLIKSIWIDGIKVSNNIVDPINGATTNIFQLPDRSFTVPDRTLTDGYKFISPSVREKWVSIFDVETKEYTDEFHEGDPTVRRKKIHAVNYYFFPDLIKQNNTELYTELYLGTKDGNNRKRKTIEAPQDFVDIMTPSNVGNEATLSPGMFANVESVRNIRLSGAIRTIGNGAFNNCQGLLTVENDVAHGVTTIGKNCFAGCQNLKEIYLCGVNAIMKQAFQGCYYLTNIYFDKARRNAATSSDSVLRYIGCGAFGYTNVRKVDLSRVKQITTKNKFRIGNSAFRRCYHLTSVTLPTAQQLTITIGKQVFTNNAILKYVLVKEGVQNNRVVYKYNSGVRPPIIVNLANREIKSVYYDYRNSTFKTVSIVTEDDAQRNIMYQYRDYRYWKYLELNKPWVRCFEQWNNFR